MATLRMVLWAITSVVVGGLIGSLAVFVGVIGLALWAGSSRNRDAARRGWRNLGRW